MGEFLMNEAEIKDTLEHGKTYMLSFDPRQNMEACEKVMGAWAYYRWATIKAALEFTLKYNGDLT
jgi:hypothetical protein